VSENIGYDCRENEQESEQKSKHIEFKRKYKKAIMSGSKSCTIRKRCYVKKGDIVFVHCGGKIIGKAEITGVEEKSLEELDDSVAREEGFRNRKELVNEIKKIYGDISKVYVIRFRFVPFDKPVNPEELYYGQSNLREIAERAIKELELSEEDKRILKLFLECGSVKKAAMRLGGIWERKKVREVLRKCSKMLSAQSAQQ